MTHLHAIIAAAAIAATGALAAAPLHAQIPRARPWKLTLAGEALHSGAWGFGPHLSIRRDLGAHWGVELTAALPAFGSNNGGAAVDLAATYATLDGPTELGGTLGVSGFLVGDASEFTGGGVGVIAGGHVTQWVAPALGFTAGATIRIAMGAYPSLYAGLTLRL